MSRVGFASASFLGVNMTRQGVRPSPLFWAIVALTAVGGGVAWYAGVEVSPLARASDSDPAITERFELFVVGRELANGYSELNDPEDQADRFHKQVAQKDAGDDEAMHFDADYVRAMEYGLPPTGGVGIGFFIWDAWNSSRLPDIVVALAYIGVVGFILDRIVALVGHVATRGTQAS